VCVRRQRISGCCRHAPRHRRPPPRRLGTLIPAVPGMQEEFKEPKYGEYHLFFTNLTREGQIQQLAQAVRRRLSRGRVPGTVGGALRVRACVRA